MSKHLLCVWAALFCFGVSAIAADDAQTKAEKEARKISAMAADPTARPLVSQFLAEYFKSTRLQLVQERKAANITYGDLFVAYQLSDGGKRFDDLLPAFKSGKNVWQIGNDMNADWKHVGGETKKLNDQLESSFYHYFLTPPQKPAADEHQYKAANDSLPVDKEGLSGKDLSAAQDTFARCYRRARGTPMKGDMPDPQNRTSSQMDTDPR
jgi:hypothetical protein